MEKKKLRIIGWYEYTIIEKNIGINGEQYGNVTNFEPIFYGETEDDARRRVTEDNEKNWL